MYENGIEIKDKLEILSDVQNDYLEIFGDELSLDPQTPQGRLIELQALNRGYTQEMGGYVISQFNPNTASGIYLDSLAMITGLRRYNATYTTVNVTVEGNGTLPTGTRFSDENNIFETTSEIIVAGQAIVQIRATVAGAVIVLANTILSFDNLIDMQVISNDAGITGADIESDYLFRNRRNNSLAQYGTASTEAIKSAINAIDSVNSCVVLENQENFSQIIEGISMLPHSLFLCVDGGTDTDISQAYYNNRPAGIPTNGDITVDIVSSSGQLIPIKFSRASFVNVFIRIAVQKAINETLAKDEILNYFSSLNIGDDVSPFEVAGSITDLSFIKNFEISSDGTIFTRDNIAIEITQKATATSAGIVFNYV